MKAVLLYVCLAFVLLLAGPSHADTSAENACQALLATCQITCGPHGGINANAANCIIDGDNVDLNCMCADGYTPSSGSAAGSKAVVTALIATAVALFA